MFKYDSVIHFRIQRTQLRLYHLLRYLRILETDCSFISRIGFVHSIWTLAVINFKVKISDLNNSWKDVANNEGQSDAELDKHHAIVRQLRRLNKTLIIERFDLQEHN